VLGPGEGGPGAVPPARCRGRALGCKPPQAGVNAVCVMVKAFSRIPKCRNSCIIYNLMSLKLHTRNHPSLQGCFSGMPLIPIPVPIWGVKISQNLRNGYLTRNRRPTRMELERVLCRWIYFHLRSKIFFWSTCGGRSPPPLWIRH